MVCNNSVTNISDSIREMFKVSRYNLPNIPPIIIMLGAKLRPGLSPQLITSRIIKRQSEAGAPVGAAPDGSANVAEAMERIRVEEIINSIVLESRIDTVIEPGEIKVVSNGGNAGGPVVSYGQNILPAGAVGTIR